MKQFDGIIFDVDGTLWDSTGIVAEAWTNAIAEHSDYTMNITSDRLKQLFGQILPDIARQLFPELSDQEQLTLINHCCEAEHQALLKTPAPLYPELESTLKILSEKYPLFIVSNCQAGYIELFLKVTGFSSYFKGHLCPGDTGNKKGANILQIMHDFSLQSAIYIGDTNGDHLACKEAGIPFVYAAYGFGDTSDPDYVISKPSDLISLF